MALQNSSIEPINTFLNRRYYIPNYQREYSWETEELEDFWNDLLAIVGDDSIKHFFGQIVIHEDEDNKKKYIIDGQQRTITSTIFMRALQVIFGELYDEYKIDDADYKKADISSIHIGRKNDLHLILGDLDNDYFKDNIQLGVPDITKKEKKKSHDRIKNAYKFFDKLLRNVISEYDDANDKYDALDEIYSAFVNRFNILYMEATKLEEAFIIFETLNARGKELETSDLLKNCIFSHSKDINVAQKDWNTMINKLDKADPTKFIRTLWNSSHALVREKELYREINKKITNPRESKQFLKTLCENAQIYHDMMFPHDSIEIQDTKLISSLKSLKILKASSFYPIILAMKQSDANFTEIDMRNVTRTIETYVFRNATICKKTANNTETFFANLAVSIYGGHFDTADSICAEIRKGMVSDNEFGNVFECWSASKSSKETVRYIFRKIHNHLDSNMELNIDNSEVHIEHIMPEDISQWSIDEATHDEYLWRLGNLALLSGPLNIKASNKPFDVKKKDSYKDSKIEPNKELLSYSVWDKDAIEDRQKYLKKLALKIWK